MTSFNEAGGKILRRFSIPCETYDKDGRFQAITDIYFAIVGDHNVIDGHRLRLEVAHEHVYSSLPFKGKTLKAFCGDAIRKLRRNFFETTLPAAFDLRTFVGDVVKLPAPSLLSKIAEFDPEIVLDKDVQPLSQDLLEKEISTGSRQFYEIFVTCICQDENGHRLKGMDFHLALNSNGKIGFLRDGDEPMFEISIDETIAEKLVAGAYKQWKEGEKRPAIHIGNLNDGTTVSAPVWALFNVVKSGAPHLLAAAEARRSQAESRRFEEDYAMIHRTYEYARGLQAKAAETAAAEPASNNSLPAPRM